MLTLGRLALDDPEKWDEAIGDVIGSEGGAVVPASRSPLKMSVPIHTIHPVQASDTLANRLMLRRQLRSMLNNTPYKLRGLYVAWDVDTEQNGWYVPDTMTLAGGAQNPLAHGWFKLDGGQWSLTGHGRTHRRATSVYMKDRHVSTYWRDYYRALYSADFSGLTALALTYLPAGTSDVVNAVSGAAITTYALAAGADGGACAQAVGLADLAVLSYEQAEASRNLGDVTVLDLRGTTGNLIPNPSFEVDLANWASDAGGGSTAALARLAASATAGSFSCAVTGNLVANQYGRALHANNVVAVTPGTTYRLRGSVAIITNIAGGFVRPQIDWYTSGGASISTTLGTATAGGATGSFTFDDAHVAPANAAFARPSFPQWSAGGTGAYEHRLDAVRMLATTASSLSYADGDTALYSWSGLAHNSTALGPGEEVYGPDYPLTAATVPDIQNGRVRVRYDGTNTPGLRVDVWNGSAFIEQGKVVFRRIGDTTGYLDTLVSASVIEYTPERAALQLVMRRAADPNSRERIVILLQRGWAGPSLELYLATKAAGTVADGEIRYVVQAADTNDSAIKIDAAGAGATQATAGSGSANFGAGTAIGAATFTGENEVALLRQGGSFGVALAVLQAAAGATVNNDSNAYGAGRNMVTIASSGAAGYISADLGFYTQQADQVMEAESMTLGTGTSSVADAAASAGNTAQSTRTTDANPHVTRATWPNNARGKYRVLGRFKTSASTLNVYAKTTTTTGATKTSAALATPAYVWIDLGDIIADGSTLEIHEWTTAAATHSCDRIEAFKLEDRTATVPTYDGARDLGQSVLFDARSYHSVVTR